MGPPAETGLSVRPALVGCHPTWRGEKSRVEEEVVLKTEEAGGIQSWSFFSFQIKEMFSLPQLLGPDTAISQTPAFIPLQMGTTSPPWSTDRLQLRGPVEKAEYGWAASHRPLPLDPLELPSQESLKNMQG